MSECVVRMEIPQNCWVCPFGLDGYIWDENDARTHYVRFCSRHSDEEYHVLETDTIDRPWYCDSFLCQLPEGHGRLVDVTKIDFVMFTNEDSTFRCGWNNGVRSVMQHAETIVPADTAGRSE